MKNGNDEMLQWSEMKAMLTMNSHDWSAVVNAYGFVTSTPAAYFAGNGQPVLPSEQAPYSRLAQSTSASKLALYSQVSFYAHGSSESAQQQRRQEQRQQNQYNQHYEMTSPVPSLFELSLRSVAVSFDELPSSLLPTNASDAFASATASAPSPLSPSLSLPSTVMAGLNEVRQVWNDGGRSCNICSRAYVNPRSEWLEIWCDKLKHCLDSDDQQFCPFLRRCCGCIDPVDTFTLGKAYSDREWSKFSAEGERLTTT